METIEHKCEGLVGLLSISEYDEFIFMEEDYCLAGKRSGKTFKIGDKVSILVVAVPLKLVIYVTTMQRYNLKEFKLSA